MYFELSPFYLSHDEVRHTVRPGFLCSRSGEFGLDDARTKPGLSFDGTGDQEKARSQEFR